jgi:hypothetical protein
MKEKEEDESTVSQKKEGCVFVETKKRVGAPGCLREEQALIK